MKESRHRNIVLIILMGFLLAPFQSHCQEFINTRKITMNRGDTVIVAGILADLKLEDVKADAFYYWYSNAGIYSNQGGFSGNLLHGDYLEYDSQGNLVLKGHYNKGLRTGVWISWYSSGGRKKELEYKDGKLNGRYVDYTNNGNIYYEARFKNDRLHGNGKEIENDTLFRLTWRNGIEIKKKAIHVSTQAQ